MNRDFLELTKKAIMTIRYYYPMYDNYRAINCNSVKDIPYDYFGYMGVPIYIIKLLFPILEMYNPKQFRIVGITASFDESDEMKSIKISKNLRHDSFIDGKKVYKRIIIKRV